MIELDALVDEIKQIIEDELGKSKAPGLGVGIVHDGRLVFEGAYGKANLEDDVPLDADSGFMIGSITKLFTVIALMQQWEQKKFDLDDPVNDYLPKGKIVTKKGWPDVTFRHLLTHQGGIGELRRFSDVFKHGFRLITYDDEPVPPLSSIHDLPLPASAPAGMKHAYSNIGVSLLGYVVELLSGEDFRDYIVKHIMDPLGMSRSDLVRSDRITGNEVLGYKFKDGQYKRARRWNNIVKPSGSVVSSINDMTKFATMLMDKGKYDGGKILEPETFDLMWTPQYRAHETFRDHYELGLVFWIYRMNGLKVLDHTGSVSGFSATFSLIPSRKLALFVFENLQEGLLKRTTKRIRNRLLKAATGLESHFDPGREPDRLLWPDIKGHYICYPGWTSNTRIITDGLEFTISAKGDDLIFSSFSGGYKKGLKLYPTEDPLVYEYPHEDDGSDVFFTTRIAFSVEDGKVNGMAREFDKLRKVSFVKTFRFRLAAISLLALAGILLGVLNLIFGWVEF